MLFFSRLNQTRQKKSRDRYLHFAERAHAIIPAHSLVITALRLLVTTEAQDHLKHLLLYTG